MSNTETITRHLDTSGLSCPMPLLKTRLELRTLQPGQVLQVTATDGGSWRDIPRYIAMSPHELLSADEVNGQYIFLIRTGV